MLKRILPVLALFLILSSGIALSAVNPIIGSWGYTHLQHDDNGTGDVNYAWSYTKYGELTYNADGTGSDFYRYGDNDQIALTESFTYTTGLNPDGSVSVTHVYNGGIKKVRRFIVSDDGQMMVMDGTDDTTNQRFNVLVKMDKTKTYSNTDLAGEYYIAGYEKDPVWAYFKAWSGISAYDGAGNYAFTGTVQDNGNITAIQGPGTYFVDGDGQILYDEVPSINSPGGARLSGNNKLVTENPGMYSSFFHMKKGDRAYSNADLAGTWALVAFGDESGTSFNAELGTMTCDAAGNCNFNFLNQRDGNLSYDIGPTLINVAADGSFGASLGDLIPAYAAAIGNDGNAIMLNNSFDFTAPWHREIFVGVKCAQCAKLPTWFENSNGFITYTGNWTVYNCAPCNGESLKFSGQTAARADFKFTGTGIKWIAAKAPNMGKAKITLDGVYMGLVDMYSPTNKIKSVFPKTGLTPGNHTLTIEVSGVKNPSSTGFNINIDSFEVIP